MPDFSSAYCNNCPYKDQNHLPPQWRQSRDVVPLDLEDNGSDILLVFQAPGEEEWNVGSPLQPVKKTGGTAGRRVLLSWGREGKNRTDFNITNAVQCFPGKKPDGRDREPHHLAVDACSGWLKDALLNGNYRKVIAFGDIACKIVNHLVSQEGLTIQVECPKHPTGGATNDDLDRLWS